MPSWSPSLARLGSPSWFDDLLVHVDTTVLHLDEHRSETALPQVALDAFRGKGQIGLGRLSTSGKNFGEQWSVHGGIRSGDRAVSGPPIATGGGSSEPGPEAAQPNGRAVGLGLIELAEGLLHGWCLLEQILYAQPVLVAIPGQPSGFKA